MASNTQTKRLQVVGYRDFVDPKDKNENWILDAIKQHYYHGNARNLLEGKDVKKIKAYAAGKHPMDKFKAMFPKSNKQANANPTDIDRRLAEKMGIDFEPLGVLQQPLAQALAALQKAEVTINFDAIDPLANDHREKDMARIRNRPEFMKAIAAAQNVLKMPLAPVEAQNAAPTVDIDTLELDPQKEDELNLWADLFYKLRPESGFEVAVQSLMEATDFKEKLDLQKRDQLYYGVHAGRCFISDITALPDFDYIFPGHMYAPDSELPDGNDQIFRYTEKNYNIEQLLNVIGKEEVDVEFLKPHFERYWKAAGYTTKTWEKASDQQKMMGIPVVYMEFKSFDVLRLEKYKSRSGRMYVDTIPFGANKRGASVTVKTKWPEQTYYAYWVPGSDSLLKSGKILGSVRQPGKESKSRFSLLYYKSKEKSDVEQCMSVVDDIQRAYIKLQQTIIMAKPPGQFIDMKYIRNAAETLAEDIDMSVDALLTLFAGWNIMIGDTEGMDGQNEGQFLPVRDIKGGIGAEVREYMTIIQDGNQRLAKLTGWNDALTGQTPNPEALVGLQKLLLQSALNSLHYAQKATKHTTEKTMYVWAPMIQYICKPEHAGTAARQALENIIGSKKIALIDDMESLSVHQFGMRIEDAPSQEEQEELRRMLLELVHGQRIDLSDYFLIRRLLNWKDAQRLLIVKEKKKAKELQKQLRESNAAIIRAQQIRSEENLQGRQIMAEGEITEEKVKGDIAQNLFLQKAQLELQLAEIDREVRLMNKRMQDDSAQRKLITKHNLDNQRSLA